MLTQLQVLRVNTIKKNTWSRIFICGTLVKTTKVLSWLDFQQFQTSALVTRQLFLSEIKVVSHVDIHVIRIKMTIISYVHADVLSRVGCSYCLTKRWEIVRKWAFFIRIFVKAAILEKKVRGSDSVWGFEDKHHQKSL